MKFKVHLTDKEWGKLAEKSKHKSVSNFLYNQINHYFRGSDGCVEGHKIERNTKNFELDLSPETELALRCKANQLGIDPTSLVVRLFILPNLLD